MKAIIFSLIVIFPFLSSAGWDTKAYQKIRGNIVSLFIDTRYRSKLPDTKDKVWVSTDKEINKLAEEIARNISKASDSQQQHAAFNNFTRALWYKMARTAEDPSIKFANIKPGLIGRIRLAAKLSRSPEVRRFMDAVTTREQHLRLTLQLLDHPQEIISIEQGQDVLIYIPEAVLFPEDENPQISDQESTKGPI